MRSIINRCRSRVYHPPPVETDRYEKRLPPQPQVNVVTFVICPNDSTSNQYGDRDESPTVREKDRNHPFKGWFPTLTILLIVIACVVCLTNKNITSDHIERILDIIERIIQWILSKA